MKTLLTINGTTLLLPTQLNDQQMVGLIKMLRGAMELYTKTNYGPEGKLHYEESAGYFTAHVQSETASKIRFELVDDSEVITAREFNERAEHFSKQLLPAAA